MSFDSDNYIRNVFKGSCLSLNFLRAYLATQGATPAQLVFGRGMVSPIGYGVDWGGVTRRGQERIGGSCGREGRRRIGHVCKEGDKVVLELPKGALRGVQRVRRGPPSMVLKHGGNGTVTIQKSPCVSGNTNARGGRPPLWVVQCHGGECFGIYP